MISFRTDVDKSNKQTNQFIHQMAGWMNWLKKQKNKECICRHTHTLNNLLLGKPYRRQKALSNNLSLSTSSVETHDHLTINL